MPKVRTTLQWKRAAENCAISAAYAGDCAALELQRAASYSEPDMQLFAVLSAASSAHRAWHMARLSDKAEARAQART